ncbi:unnamed protein product [Dibothriocephalus latus]|uniref:Uncharacterized protein n=1 Tax=Dibothriocephalus latus TaxID=60516 RepID=A0A3P6UC57_DIBLA|nr:unnamed protein product [Dibothriocephalus latus]
MKCPCTSTMMYLWLVTANKPDIMGKKLPTPVTGGRGADATARSARQSAQVSESCRPVLLSQAVSYEASEGE